MAFKMYGKSPMAKKLIGKQKNLPEALKAEIRKAPESPMDMYKDSPMEMKKRGCGCKSAMCMCGPRHKK